MFGHATPGMAVNRPGPSREAIASRAAGLPTKQGLLTNQQRLHGPQHLEQTTREGALAWSLRIDRLLMAAIFDGGALDEGALERLFLEARSIQTFTARPIADETIHRLYELVKLTPTGFNCQPGRYVYVRSTAAKEQLAPALSSSNRKKMMAAPLTVIVGYDPRFYEKLPLLFPGYDARALFLASPGLAQQTADRNSTLQAAFLILGARALGLDAGPMSGFRAPQIDRAFFPGGQGRTNMLVNLGYGDRSALAPRGARLTFEETVRIL
jgi:3-hydroxypropanoate dehydrogenase